MSIFKKQNLGLGLELGENSGKAVLLEHDGSHPVIRQALCLNRLSEGFLNEQEMTNALGEWLEDQNLLRYPAACSLPQHLTLEAVYDFPPEMKRGNLRKMVDFQSQSLCGITEEKFICSDQRLASRKDGRNRILIAASRELIVDRCFEKFAGMGADVRIMAENGQALANAFVNLHPREFSNSALQMILNMGRNSTSIVLFGEGSLCLITGLTVGSELFCRGLMQSLQCDEYQAEKEIRTWQADWTDPKSPSARAMRSFVNELRTVLEHWRQNPNDSPDCPRDKLGKIWLTGSGALQPGLAERLGQLMDCPAERFGVPREMLRNAGVACPCGLDFHPQLTQAYGLALQAVGKSLFTVSLLPDHQERKLRHFRDFPYLCLGVACGIAMLLTMIFSWIWGLNQRIASLEASRRDLLQCRELIPEIEKSEKELRLRYRRMLPLIEYGRRSHLFIQALVNCQRVLREPGQEKLTAWGIYLADEFSFAADHGTLPEEKISEGGLGPGVGKNHFLAPDEKKYQAGEKTAPREPGNPPGEYCQVDALPRLRKMFLGGITEQNESRFETLKKIQGNFTLEQLFANVDDYTDFYQERFPVQNSAGWRYFLEKQQSQLTSRFTIFLLQLPFLEEVSE